VGTPLSEGRTGDGASRRTASVALRLVLLVYVGVSVMVAAFADRLIFVPPTPSYGSGVEDLVMLPTARGDTIAAFHRVVPGATLTVLFAHGNAEDIGDGRPHLERYAGLGVSVLAFDYPGYGASSGEPSERGAYAAADAAYDYLTAEIGLSPEAVVAHGRSLGGGVMVDLASRRRIGGLIVESSFVSAYRVMIPIRVLPFDQFENLAKMPAVDAPVLVIHGERDEVIPAWHGRRLWAVVPDDRRSALWVPGAGHNDLAAVAGDSYWDALADFLGRVGSSLREGS